MTDILGSTARVAGSSAMAGAAGILTRPCCLAPALLSLSGGSAAGLGQLFTSHRTAFAAISLVMLTVSIWTNIRVQAPAWNKWLAAVMSIGAFLLVARGMWW